jgi:hypothetical protein
MIRLDITFKATKLEYNKRILLMKRYIFLGDHVLCCDIISFGAKDQFRIEM